MTQSRDAVYYMTTGQKRAIERKAHARFHYENNLYTKVAFQGNRGFFLSLITPDVRNVCTKVENGELYFAVYYGKNGGLIDRWYKVLIDGTIVEDIE